MYLKVEDEESWRVIRSPALIAVHEVRVASLPAVEAEIVGFSVPAMLDSLPLAPTNTSISHEPVPPCPSTYHALAVAALSA